MGLFGKLFGNGEEKELPVDTPFLLEYDEFGEELIAKSNERFLGTKADTSRRVRGGFWNMSIINRSALTTTIANDPQLRSTKIWPITPLQSEIFLRDGKLPKQNRYDRDLPCEDLGLLLYDTSPDGSNPMEARALYESLLQQREEFGLSQSDLNSRLLVVRTGLEVDSSMPYGVKPVAIPGVTQIHVPEMLYLGGKYPQFGHGLDNGFPEVKEVGKGYRILYTPHETQDIGLRKLVRHNRWSLSARYKTLTHSSYFDGRITLIREIPEENLGLPSPANGEDVGNNTLPKSADGIEVLETYTLPMSVEGVEE